MGAARRRAARRPPATSERTPARETHAPTMTASAASTRRNFIGLLWHGTFLAGASALVEPTTILPAYIAGLGGSPALIGLTITILLTGDVLPQLAFAHVVEGSPRKRRFLLVAVYSRAAAWLVLGLATWLLQRSSTGILLGLLVLLLAAFAMGGSLGGVAYTDVYGKSIPPGSRGRFYATRQLIGSLVGVGTAAIARLVLASGIAPLAGSYALLFTGSGVLMLVAGIGFVLVREEPGPPRARPPLRAFLRQLRSLWRDDRSLRALVLIENLASLHLMILPFYAVMAIEALHVPTSTVAVFAMVQVAGGALSNLLWGRLNDRVGSGAVLRACLALGSVLPLLALLLAAAAPAAYGLVFLFLGAATNSRSLAFNNVLVDRAPAGLRATYTGMVGTLTAPALLLPLLGGALIGLLGFQAVFVGVAAALALTWVGLGRTRVLLAPPRG